MTGVAVDATGHIFALRTGPRAEGDLVLVYDTDGSLLGTFGSQGSGDGQFGRGWVLGIALDGQGNAYLADPGLERLEKFHLLAPLAP